MAIRPLQPFDIARYKFLGGSGLSNRAHPLGTLGRETPPIMLLMEVSRRSLPLPRNKTSSCVWTSGIRVLGVAAARPRSGVRAWEVSHLLLSSEDDTGHGDLLRSLCQSVAPKGGERVFIRLQREDPLVRSAALQGFEHSTHELLYRGRARPLRSRHPINIREIGPADEHSVFRLYCAAVPSDTRKGFGMTLDQWAASKERGRGRSREFVHERDGRVTGWGRAVKERGTGKLELLVHPDHEQDVAGLMSYGLAQLSGTRAVFCLVSEQQVLLQRLLEQEGFEMSSGYVTMVRPMVVPVSTEKARKAITIASV